jgi:ribosomal protein S18 acetylase RimI-like enzyme
MWLDVKPDNRRARALYESEGFTVERELPADPREPGGPVAMVVLAREM